MRAPLIDRERCLRTTRSYTILVLGHKARPRCYVCHMIGFIGNGFVVRWVALRWFALMCCALHCFLVLCFAVLCIATIRVALIAGL